MYKVRRETPTVRGMTPVTLRTCWWCHMCSSMLEGSPLYTQLPNRHTHSERHIQYACLLGIHTDTYTYWPPYVGKDQLLLNVGHEDSTLLGYHILSREYGDGRGRRCMWEGDLWGEESGRGSGEDGRAQQVHWTTATIPCTVALANSVTCTKCSTYVCGGVCVFVYESLCVCACLGGWMWVCGWVCMCDVWGWGVMGSVWGEVCMFTFPTFSGNPS